jgi:hypothetical protein
MRAIGKAVESGADAGKVIIIEQPTVTMIQNVIWISSALS